MAAYRRFVIYLYWCREGNVQNVGFSKIELQNNKCRIEIHLKGLPQKEAELPVYLLHREEKEEGEPVLWGIELGRIGIKRGSGSFARLFSGARIAGSPFSYQDMGGLLVPLQEDEMIAGQWDNRDIIRQQFRVWRPAQERETADGVAAQNGPVDNAAAQNRSTDGTAAQNKPTNGAATQNKPADRSATQNRSSDDTAAQNGPTADDSAPGQSISDTLKISEIPQIKNDDLILYEDNLPMWKQRERYAKNNSGFKNGNQYISSENRKNISDWGQMWRMLSGSRECFPPMAGKDAEAVKIDLKDLHLLPGELWNLGNNSFLLHGFFNYRFLLYGRMAGENSTPYYFIGIPGVFSNQEKVLAAIFGFPEFYLEKPAEIRTGKSGYWCKLLSSSDSNAYK